MARDHEPLIIEDFRGLYSRPEGDTIPLGYLSICKDMQFRSTFGAGAKIATRSPVEVAINWPGGAVLPILRFYWYPKSTGGRFIGLDSAGNFWDTALGVAVGVVAGAVDFTGMTINDHFYLTPHNRNIGMAPALGRLLVYDPVSATPMRTALGVIPAGVFTVAAGAAGNTEPGTHILAIANETSTGFVTKPALYQVFNAPTPRTSISLTAIPLGPAGTVARHILMTKRILNYDGNPAGYELFQALKINDNVTVALANAINLYDTQLIDSKEYLKDNLEVLPAGIQMCLYEGRLAVCGENANSSLIRVSKAGEPESFSAIDGFIEVFKGFGGSVRNIRATHGVLYAWKRYATYAIRANDNAPSSWKVEQIDAGLGAEAFSVGEVWESPDSSYRGGFFVGNYNGLYYLNGTSYESKLSWAIDKSWSENIIINNVENLSVVFDSFNQCLYVLVSGRSAFTAGLIYYGDIEEGIDARAVKWSKWLETVDEDGITTIHLFIQASDGKPLLLFQRPTDSFISKVATNNSGALDLEANADAEIEVIFTDPEQRLMHMSPVKIAGHTDGENMQLDIVGQGPSETYQFSIIRKKSILTNVIGDLIKVKFKTVTQNWFGLYKVILNLVFQEEEEAA